MLSPRLKKKTHFIFLFIETGGRKNDETFTVFLIKYIDTNTTLGFKAQYTTSVDEKHACYFGFVLFDMTDLCWYKLLNKFCQML